jgi:uncharacterized protein (DUF4415 family)
MARNAHSTKHEFRDPDDAPELDEAWFDEADLRKGQAIVRRGRPKSARTKEQINIRLSADVLAAFRATGPGWQTRIDEALKEWLREHSPQP